jgi:hypothetical protein
LEEAGEYDITIEQGSGFSLPLTYAAPEDSPVDFTGSTARLQVREKYSSADTLIELTTENGGIELGDNGSIQLSISATDTAELSFSRGVYDLENRPAGRGTVQDHQGQRIPQTRGDAMSRNKVVVEESVVRVVTVGIQGPPGVGISQAYIDAGEAASRQRANHTGTQPSSTISDFSTAVDARITVQRVQRTGLPASIPAARSRPPSCRPWPITDTFVVASQAAMLALTAEVGDRPLVMIAHACRASDDMGVNSDDVKFD